jgi:hypothetical protein
MRVELYGPAASGKTTLARSLADELRVRGIRVRLASSARPAEAVRPGALPPWRSVAQRAAKAFRAMALLRNRSPQARAIDDLLGNMSPVWRLRYRSYLAWLDDAWTASEDWPGVVIFDQAHVCALGAVMARDETLRPDRIMEALRASPRADVLAHVTASPDVIARRLEARLAGQGRLERLLEIDAISARRQPRVFETLHQLLETSGAAPLQIASADPAALTMTADRIAMCMQSWTPPRAVAGPS